MKEIPKKFLQKKRIPETIYDLILRMERRRVPRPIPRMRRLLREPGFFDPPPQSTRFQKFWEHIHATLGKHRFDKSAEV